MKTKGLLEPMFKVRDKEEPRNFKDKLVRNKLYHFKVIQLKQYEDMLREH